MIFGDAFPDLHLLKVLSDELGTNPGRANVAFVIIVAIGMAATETSHWIWRMTKLVAYVLLAAMKRLPDSMKDPADVTHRSYALRFGILVTMMLACVILIEVPV